MNFNGTANGKQHGLRHPRLTQVASFSVAALASFALFTGLGARSEASRPAYGSAANHIQVVPAGLGAKLAQQPTEVHFTSEWLQALDTDTRALVEQFGYR